MQESFLHYIWQMQYYNKNALQTTDREAIVIVHPGILNDNAGPDFSGARLRIGGIEWSGSVELHIQSSQWKDHHHDTDPAYDNVILHVVWSMDSIITRRDGTALPTVELKGRVDPALLRKYRQLVTSAFQIPCRRSLREVPEVVRWSAIERALVDRLERKSREILGLYEVSRKDWEEAFYLLLSRNFGFKVNSDPFLRLARAVPLKLIRKHSGSLLQVEALLFGVAGFLEGNGNDDYYARLQQEFRLLCIKFGLKEHMMMWSQWKFLRLRPANFPSLRIAQLASILHSNQQLFSRVLEIHEVKELLGIFSAEPSPYWKGHYHFKKVTGPGWHVLGKDSIHNILINTVAPAWAAYGMLHHDDVLLDRAIQLLKDLPAEENAITQNWKNVGIELHNSYDSQASIELFNNFCQKKRCLNCPIGAFLIRPLNEIADPGPD